MEIFAHRGLLDLDPRPIENSMYALAAALGAGFSIETDFRFGRHQEIVVFHDDDLRRLFDDSRTTNRVGASELKRLFESRSGLEEPDVASLDALLRWPVLASPSSSVGVLVNIKEPDDFGFVTAVCERITREGREGSTWLFDMEQSMIPRIHEAFPSTRLLARLSHLEGEGIDEVTQLVTKVSGVWFDDYHGELLGSPVESMVTQLGIPLFYVSPELHSETHPLGRTGYESAWLQVLRNPAFVGICTDHPHDLRRVVEEFEEES